MISMVLVNECETFYGDIWWTNMVLPTLTENKNIEKVALCVTRVRVWGRVK